MVAVFTVHGLSMKCAINEQDYLCSAMHLIQEKYYA